MDCEIIALGIPPKRETTGAGANTVRLRINSAANFTPVMSILVWPPRTKPGPMRGFGKLDAPLLALGLSGLIVLSVDYTTSYEDAMRGVVQWNEKKRLNLICNIQMRPDFNRITVLHESIGLLIKPIKLTNPKRKHTQLHINPQLFLRNLIIRTNYPAAIL